jgi:hypothetical protein
MAILMLLRGGGVGGISIADYDITPSTGEGSLEPGSHSILTVQ